MTALSFCVPGQPRTYKRVSSRGRQRFKDRDTRAYMNAVSARAKQAVDDVIAAGIDWPKGARYGVEIHVTRETRHACDLDNFAKVALDGCKNIVWHDDARVDDLRVLRHPPSKSDAQLVVIVRVLP